MFQKLPSPCYQANGRTITRSRQKMRKPSACQSKSVCLRKFTASWIYIRNRGRRRQRLNTYRSLTRRHQNPSPPVLQQISEDGHEHRLCGSIESYDQRLLCQVNVAVGTVLWFSPYGIQRSVADKS